MSKGENIFKRKDGRWEARYIKGYELSGKIKYGYCYGKTYKEAKEKVSKYKVALVSGLPIPDKNSRHRFSYYCDMWLETRQPKIKEATFVKYQTILECHIKPQLGGSFPLRMTDGLLQTFTNSLQEYDGLAPKTVKDILVVLRSIIKYTAKQFPGIFPVLEIPYPREPKKEMRVLTAEEQDHLVSFLLDDTKNLFLHLFQCSVVSPLGGLIRPAAGGVRNFFKGHGLYGPVLDFTVYQHCFPDRPTGIAEAQMLGNRALFPVGQVVVSLVQCVI